MTGTNYMDRLTHIPPAQISMAAIMVAKILHPDPETATPSAWLGVLAARRAHELKALDAQFLAWRQAAPRRPF